VGGGGRQRVAASCRWRFRVSVSGFGFRGLQWSRDHRKEEAEGGYGGPAAAEAGSDRRLVGDRQRGATRHAGLGRAGSRAGGGGGVGPAVGR
jgi:hypothetical protein